VSESEGEEEEEEEVVPVVAPKKVLAPKKVVAPPAKPTAKPVAKPKKKKVTIAAPTVAAVELPKEPKPVEQSKEPKPVVSIAPVVPEIESEPPPRLRVIHRLLSKASPDVVKPKRVTAMSELWKQAQSKGIKGYNKMKKVDLEKLLG